MEWKRIVERLEASIEISSEIGSGTIVKLLFSNFDIPQQLLHQEHLVN
ncbi:hypothetical protein [Sphingobacterium sp. LRF_L2]